MRLPAGDLPSRSVAVGMKDIRVSNKLVRSLISENRRDISTCFSELIIHFRESGMDATSQSHEFGPFFFYFAALHHSSCKCSGRRRQLMHNTLLYTVGIQIINAVLVHKEYQNFSGSFPLAPLQELSVCIIPLYHTNTMTRSGSGSRLRIHS